MLTKWYSGACLWFCIFWLQLKTLEKWQCQYMLWKHNQLFVSIAIIFRRWPKWQELPLMLDLSIVMRWEIILLEILLRCNSTSTLNCINTCYCISTMITCLSFNHLIYVMCLNREFLPNKLNSIQIMSYHFAQAECERRRKV